MPRPSAAAPPSLRTELLVTTALLAAAAVLVAVVGAVFLPAPPDGVRGALFLGALVAGDVGIFVAFGAYQIRRLVTRPLDAAVQATEAIAAGDLSRRLPAGGSSEFVSLSASVNRMTDNLLEEQGQRLRAEKLATVGRLAAGIAHEVGNPLGAIGGYAHILRARTRRIVDAAPADDQTVRDALDGIERETARIDRIVRGLLDYASPRRITPARIDVNDVLRGALTLLGDQGLLRRVAVDAALDQSAPLPLVGQRHELEQIFVNVLLNAVDALEGADGGGTGRLVVRTRRVSAQTLVDPAARRAGDDAGRDEFGAVPPERRRSPRVQAWLERSGQLAGDATRPSLAQIVIADSGPGVAEEHAERIFDPFFTTKEPGRGTGLGLAIVARVVEGLRGAVWVQPSREGGAAFVVVFPLADAPTGAPPSVPASAVPPLARTRSTPRQTRARQS